MLSPEGTASVRSVFHFARCCASCCRLKARNPSVNVCITQATRDTVSQCCCQAQQMSGLCLSTREALASCRLQKS
eukprot:1161405-Pelagomonas_calceolata.AAC.7